MLLESRPDIAKYIRKLAYEVENTFDDRPPVTDDYLLSPILPNLLRTISRLNCLKISALNFGWNKINPFLTSAFLHLMHLPTINHIGLSSISNFPMSSLRPSVNLLRLDISNLDCIDLHGKEIVFQSGMMPQIREFRTSDSPKLTTTLLHAKRQDDGQPAFNIMNLRRLSSCLEDKRNLLYLLQNAKLLEELYITVECGQNLEGLHDVLSASARTLKVLGFTTLIYETYYNSFPQPLEGVCEGLEVLAGHDMLETLSFEIEVFADYEETVDSIGSLIQNVEKVLAKPGWSALRQIFFKVPITGCLKRAELSEALQSLPDKYLSHLSKLDSIDFNFSASVVKCAFEY